MSAGLEKTSSFLSRLSKLSLWLAGIGLVVMTMLVAWQVFCRYVLNNSPSWTEPGSVMLMSWFIFLGAAVGVRENYHLGFDVLLYVLPSSGKKWLRMISDLVALGFGVGMVWYGSPTGQPDLEHDLAVARHFGWLGLRAVGCRRRTGLSVFAGTHSAASFRRAYRRDPRRNAASRSGRRTRQRACEGLTRWKYSFSSASSHY